MSVMHINQLFYPNLQYCYNQMLTRYNLNLMWMKKMKSLL